ncbi:fatty acyl-CoA hydrolase precursor, medium chain [Bombus fervidus]|uniref:fatty acyl-CoA hydrolase precursor, medium chain n=1 Tax=Bombus fervidus TaxID=203811 RepID=UPI003D18DA1F
MGMMTIIVIIISKCFSFLGIWFRRSVLIMMVCKFCRDRFTGLTGCIFARTHVFFAVFGIYDCSLRNKPSDGWPVMVWFHGGDFNTGTPAIWNASIFVSRQKVSYSTNILDSKNSKITIFHPLHNLDFKNDHINICNNYYEITCTGSSSPQIMVITVAYRLNILGFFTTMDSEAPGNYGMFDQIASLDWIQKKIQHFGGSPYNVVIYGHSSGAISVGLHLVSPLSRGKFSKAIAMSGDAVSSVGSPQNELPVVDIVTDTFGCYRRPTSALMECLRRVNVTALVDLTSSIETWGPIVDYETNNSTEPFLPMHPKDILDSGTLNSVPLIVGYTNNEQALAYIESLDKGDLDGKLSYRNFEMMITDEFVSLVQEDNSTCELKPEMVAEAVLFFYKPHPPSKDQGNLRDRYLDLQTEKKYAAGLTLLAGKVSKEKLAYVYRFDYRPKTQSVIKDVPEWAGVPHMFELPFFWGLPQMTNSPVQWNFADKKMAEVVMGMLGNFAKNGNPGIVKWESYTEEDPGILIIDRNLDMSDSNVIDYKALAFWNEYYPMILKETMNNCCNMTSHSTAWREASYGVVLSGFAVVTMFWYLEL